MTSTRIFPAALTSTWLDNYGTHKVTKVRTWLARHPRYHVHYTPTSGSWLNLVERLFAEVTERCVRRGSHTAVRSLEKAMLDYLDERNKDPKPFVWTADADLILGKVTRLSKRISDSGYSVLKKKPHEKVHQHRRAGYREDSDHPSVRTRRVQRSRRGGY